VLDTVRQLLEHSPLLALFAAIGIGYAIGRISIAGFSLDIGAVLFAGLALGAFAPKAAPPALVGSIGLVMFLYGIGIQYGRQFFAGLAGPGLLWNAIGGAGVAAGLLVTIVAIKSFGVPVPQAIGLFAGSLTSTPTLQAAIDAAGNRDPALGYSLAYPMGVIGPILLIYMFTRVVRARLASAAAPPAPLEIALSAEWDGTAVRDVIAALPPGVSLIAVRRGATNQLPELAMRLAAGDIVLLFGEPASVEDARKKLGHAAPGVLAADREAIDVQRFFVSREAIAGLPIGRVGFPDGIDARIVEVRRGDASLVAETTLVLEHGDRVTVLAARPAMAALRAYFGDSIKSTTQISYISVGLGMSLGVLLGLVPVPIPGVGQFSLGVAGGPLVAALILGRLGRVGSLSWHLPLPANLTLRNFGLTLFLAAVGLGSGAPFVETLATAGLPWLLIGTAIVLTAVAAGFVLGQWVFKLSTDDLLGVVSGITGNPAILVYANKTMTSDRIDAAFATIFPSMTILKILCAQIAIGAFR
jgi:putative transport protein